MLSLEINSIEDDSARENFRLIQEYLSSLAIIKGNFSHYTFSTNKAGDFRVKHNLSYTPKDVLVTYVSSGSASVKHSLTTNEYITISVTSPCVVRLLVGLIDREGEG